MTGGLRDRVLHRRKRFGMANCNVDRLQCPNACSALSEVGVGVHQDLQRPVKAYQKVGKVPVNNSGQVGPCALREI